MVEQLSFGVGCFHFAPRQMSPENFSRDVFVADLKMSLESINSVKDVSIEGFEWFSGGDASFVHDGPAYMADSIGEGPGLFPHAVTSTIQFEIFIPMRLQRELLETSDPMTNNESFRVTIYYLDYFPVTLVRGVEQHTTDPSHAVVLVRRFLETEFSNGKELPIDFQFLGPSPFHADFFLKTNTLLDVNDVETIRFNKVKTYGYDDITIEVTTRKSNLAASKQKAIKRIMNELSYYYFLVQWRSIMYDIWAEIEESVEKLKVLISDRSMFAKSRSIFQMQKHIDTAFFHITDLNTRVIHMNQSHRKWKREFLSRNEEFCIAESIEEELESGMRFPTDQMLQLVNLFESRRTVTAQNFAVLLSAVLGGIIGSGITALFNS